MSGSPSYEPIEINAFFRSHTHLPLWEILDKAGFWEHVGIKVNFEFCDSSSEAEAALSGRPASEASFRQAAEAALKDAKPLAHNAYKVELGKRAIVRALMRASRLS